MQNNLERYAEKVGLNPKKAGEVLLTAADASSEIDLCTTDTSSIDPDALEKIGIKNSDTKAEVIQKIRTALASADSKAVIDAFFGDDQTPGDEKGLTEVIRGDLNAVLKWLGTENES